MDFLRAASDALFKTHENETANPTPDIDERKIIAHVKNKVEESRRAPSRMAFESSVVTNTAYLLGYDSLYYDSKIRIFRNYAGGAGSPVRGRIHRNLILPTIQNRLAKLCKNPPRFDVRPNSNNEDDKQAARLGLKVLLNVLDRERYNEKRIEATMWMQQAGYSWVRVYWDDDKGNKIPDPQEDGSVDYVSEGDIGIEVVSPLEIFTDPMAKRVEDLSWLVHARVRPLEYYRDKYENGYQVKAEDAWLQSTMNLLRIQQMNNKSGLTAAQHLMKNSAIELAYYERPCKKFPQGRLIITANGVLLAYKPLPCDEIPFIKFDDVKIGGKFHSESLITHMRPLQDQMNRILRRKAEFINKCLSAKIMAPKGHGMIEESLTDDTEVLEYNPVPNGAEPHQLTNPQMPQYAFQEDQSLQQNFGEIAGISEVSKGQMPSASIPAIGMQLLVEMDDSRVGIVVESNENSHADVGRLVLKYASKYYELPRMIKENGKSGEYTFTEVTSEKLRDSHDVIVMRGSTLPGSKVLKRQDLLNLYSQGLLGDPADPLVRSKLLEALEFGDIGNAWEQIAVDSAQVERSIKMMEQGIKPLVHIDDNHAMHFDKKNELRKSEKFKTYQPEIQALILANIEMHKSFLGLPAQGLPGHQPIPPPPGMPGGPPPMGAPSEPPTPQEPPVNEPNPSIGGLNGPNGP